MIGKRELLLSFSLMLMATVMNAKEITFDFSKPDLDNQFYGYTAPSGSEKLYFNGKTIISGDCRMTFDDSGTEAPQIRYLSSRGLFFLQIFFENKLTIYSQYKITNIKFEFVTDVTSNSISGWVANVGSLDTENAVWDGDSNEVEFTATESTKTYLTKIKVTLMTEDDYTEINTVSDLKAVADYQHVLFNSESVCIAQSTDAMKVSASCGDDILYFLSETTPLATTEKGMVISSGVLGSKTTVDGVPAITVLGGYESKSVYAATEIGLASVSDDYIGKMVSINNVAVINEDDMLKLSDATNKLAINNIFLGTINTTNSSKRADVVGVIAKDNSGYVIHPVSVVEKLYSASESMSMTMPAADVTVSNGAIIISGEWNHSEVYTIDGRLVASNKSQIACGSGIYLVVVDGVSIAKVTLR